MPELLAPDYGADSPAFNAFQCSAMWGFGHRCASNHGHAAFPCKCACGEEQPPLSQCPMSPGMFVGGQFVIPVTPS